MSSRGLTDLKSLSETDLLDRLSDEVIKHHYKDE